MGMAESACKNLIYLINMNAVPGAYILTIIKLILNISASIKMIKRNEYHGKSKKRR